jgi:hypothetical protein
MKDIVAGINGNTDLPYASFSLHLQAVSTFVPGEFGELQFSVEKGYEFRERKGFHAGFMHFRD